MVMMMTIMMNRYADTDSMFIHCKGYRREDAFALGRKLEGKQIITILFNSLICINEMIHKVTND